jgi:hypothetical protein
MWIRLKIKLISHPLHNIFNTFFLIRINQEEYRKVHDAIILHNFSFLSDSEALASAIISIASCEYRKQCCEWREDEKEAL